MKLMDRGIMLDMRVIFVVVSLFFLVRAQGQAVWEIPKAEQEIQLDGFIDEWPTNLPRLLLSPTSPMIRVTGEFGKEDLSLSLRFLWDSQNLYVAVEWEDDEWDLKQVRRNKAVWVSPDRRRRDRMHFFDNLKFHIQRSEYDYILWTSPRAKEQGPFVWQRLLEGVTGMETATSPPLVTGRFRANKVTMEIMFYWKQLRIKPKRTMIVPLTLIVADSDLPGGFLESKLNQLKWLEWKGQVKLTASQ